MAVRYPERDPLVPPQQVDDFVRGSVVPRWVKYGGIATGAALVLARLGGIAYADDGHHGHGGGDHDHGVLPHSSHASAASAVAHGDHSPAAVQAGRPTTVRGEEFGDLHGAKVGEAVNNDDHNRHGPAVKSAKSAGSAAASVKAAATAAANETAGTVQGDTAVRPAATVAGTTVTAKTGATPAAMVTPVANETPGTAHAATAAASETGGTANAAVVTAKTRLSPRTA